jgi:signal transduction histidine kinase
LKNDESISIEGLRKQLEVCEKDNKALLKLAVHDLRSPLNKIFALISLFKLLDDELSPEQASYLDKMAMVISDGLNSMRNLTDLRAIENGGNELIFETIAVGKLVDKVIRDQVADATRKEIKMSFAEVDISITSDKFSCLRILDHLISNAIKFSPKGSDILVEIKEEADDLLIHITDGGHGINQDEQLKLFQKFSPLSTRSTGGESTTGIGLFLASSLAKKVGGNVAYNNDNGSVFTLRLPKVSLA